MRFASSILATVVLAATSAIALKVRADEYDTDLYVHGGQHGGDHSMMEEGPGSDSGPHGYSGYPSHDGDVPHDEDSSPNF